MAGQACSWAGVGASNAPSNQSRTRGLKWEREDTSPRIRGQARKLSRAGEDRVEHRLGEPAGERVLLGHVEGAEHWPALGLDLGAVLEPGPGTGSGLAQRRSNPQRGVPCE